MKRINLIYNNAIYREKFDKLQVMEKNRVFCNHTLEHNMDVARLMYIKSLEDGIGLDKEIIYATALMHDIGRLEQYENNVPHEEAGAKLCDIILPECEFVQDEISEIKEAVIYHRKGADENESKLAKLLRWADKNSRCC
ncbi:MAG: HD domain-containing protein, partial [Lachnospiraceae bacterium]|nr:HD domain-containing protein [Lachnospiraceae bacterium]